MKSPLDGVLAASYVSPKAVLYGIAVGIAVVGGENSIQRPGLTAGCLKSLFPIPERIYYFHFPNLRKWLFDQVFPGIVISSTHFS
jgi:hypothetical protein